MSAIQDYSPNGPVAQRIAAAMPAFPFKGIPMFYDIGGVTRDPEIFQLVIDVFVARYRDLDVDSICGLDARGFIFGPPIALALKKPFFMLRKKGKMPNTVTGSDYTKEYAGTNTLSISRGSVKPGDKVLVIDDLVATGGTLCAAIELIKKMGGTVAECACMVQLTFLEAAKKFEGLGYGDVPIWALCDESLTYVEKGAAAASTTAAAGPRYCCARHDCPNVDVLPRLLHYCCYCCYYCYYYCQLTHRLSLRYPDGLMTEPIGPLADYKAGKKADGVVFVNERGVYVDDGEAH